MLHMSIERIKDYMCGNQAVACFRTGYHHVKITVTKKIKSQLPVVIKCYICVLEHLIMDLQQF